ncbi:hypothetical protein Ddye_016547 [Dipteronia dyeriana]|uniref:Uncharacterized protein n=1 Tax=Dipteronia dyeriana TaxID=168575 RepID=A0AAD9U7Q0_9ROSI|nr:hypothetical protein Ddye_016547 [Dipteronia dyeriana]
MIQDSDDSCASSEFSDFSEPDLPSEAYQVTNKSDLSLGPQIQVQILAELYSKPIPVIAYFDTCAHSTMMNPRVLPPDAWKKKDNEFLVADGQIFTTNLVSKYKVGIQFFPACTLWTHVIGTPLPDKDVLIGWDVYSQSKFIRIFPTGIRFKLEFKPFSSLLKIFPLSVIFTTSPRETLLLLHKQPC